MRFTKMHGLGNDYIYIYEDDVLKENRNDEYYQKLAIKLSVRHFSVGADGIILIKPSSKADFFMQIYNADGSKGEMCGNGIRCVGKYVYERGLTKKTKLVIDTLAGLKYLDLILEDNLVKEVIVDMGEPMLHDGSPVSLKALHNLMIDDNNYEVMDISMGNPHTVIYVDEITDYLVLEVGPKIENDSYYPNRTNVEFVKVVDSNTLEMRVWERGSGETMACGTGACAVATSYMLKNPNIREVNVKLRGGILNIKWNKDNHILMRGEAAKVFVGEVEDDIIK